MVDRIVSAALPRNGFADTSSLAGRCSPPGAVEQKEMVAARKVKAVGGLGAGSFEIAAALGAGDLVLTFDNRCVENPSISPWEAP